MSEEKHTEMNEIHPEDVEQNKQHGNGKENADEEKADEVLQEESSEEIDPLEKLQTELEEWKAKTLRLQADYDNFRKRSRAEKETEARYRAQPVIEALLPALDNFERALDHQTNTAEEESIQKGMSMIYEQIFDALKAEGLEEIPAEGEAFDPNVHQAVMQVEEEGFESNQIVEELQKGYKLKERVIRPAMVKVNA